MGIKLDKDPLTVEQKKYSSKIVNGYFVYDLEGSTLGINGSFGSPEKKLDFSKANTKFCLNLHYNADNSYWFVNENEIFKFKGDNRNLNLPTLFCFGSISNGFRAIECREISLNGNMYHFLVDYSSINKYDLLNIHKYLMIKNNIK